MNSLRKGFTLLELMAVILIIALLMAVIVAMSKGGIESARSAKCLANMRNLATSVVSVAMGSGKYPLAGSVEWYERHYNRGSNTFTYKYYETLGWIRWDSKNAYHGNDGSVRSSLVGNFENWYVSTYTQDVDVRKRVMGVSAFDAVPKGGENDDVENFSEDDNDDEEIESYVESQVKTGFVCSEHIRTVRNERPKSLKPKCLPPLWSYVMNEKFGWQVMKGKGSYSGGAPRVGYTAIARPDKILLFAEMCWTKIGGKEPGFSQEGGTKYDCVLQYKGKDPEVIGFNHRSGRDLVAHVVFADTHVEVIRMPKGGESWENRRNLTRYLCNGDDWGIVGKSYKIIHENKDDTNDDN